MDIISAYREVGSYRGAAAISGTTAKTVKRVIARHEAGGAAPDRRPRGRNTDVVVELVAERVEKTKEDHREASAARARAAGYRGRAHFSGCRLAYGVVASASPFRGRRCGHRVSSGHRLGVLGGRTCSARCSRVPLRFVRFADNSRADTTLALLAECFDLRVGSRVVLAAVMVCLKAGWSRLRSFHRRLRALRVHHGFRPTSRGRDPESKDRDSLVGYAKPSDDPRPDVLRRSVHSTSSRRHRGRVCVSSHAAIHSEISRVPPAACHRRELLPRCPRCGRHRRVVTRGRRARVRPVRPPATRCRSGSSASGAPHRGRPNTCRSSPPGWGGLSRALWSPGCGLDQTRSLRGPHPRRGGRAPGTGLEKRSVRRPTAERHPLPPAAATPGCARSFVG